MAIPRQLILAFTTLSLFSFATSAEESAQPLITALSSTTISGYVDSGSHWNPGSGNYAPAPVTYGTAILWKHEDGRMAVWQMSGIDLMNSFGLLRSGAPHSNPIALEWGRLYSQRGDHILIGGSYIHSRSLPGRGLPFAGVAQVIGWSEPDIIWAAGAQIVVWEMRGGRIVQEHNVYNRSNLPTEARVVGINRFDNNLSMDLVWQDPRGVIWITLMDGLRIRETVMVNGGKRAISNWMPRATGDFNFDGKTDLLWLNKDGRTAVWFMNGTTKIGSAPLRGGRPVAPGWDIVDAEQFFLMNVSPIPPGVDAGAPSVVIPTLPPRTILTNRPPTPVVPAPPINPLPAELIPTSQRAP